MKYIKYLTLCLLMALVASCSDVDVTYQFEEVDNNNKAYVQIYYVVPLPSVPANYIYYVDINSVEHGNDGSTFLATYNFIPSGGVALYYAVDAGDLNIAFKGKDKVVKYSGTVKDLKPGKHYLAFVYDLTQEPKLLEAPEVPTFPGTAETATHCSVRFFNFLYEADGTPFTDKIQYALKNTETGEYENVGEPVAFGEATSYFTPTIKKTVFNSQGYQRRDLTLFRIDANTGENLGQIKYTTVAGKEATFTYWWTWYIGRAYLQLLSGNRTNKANPMTLKQFGAL